MAEHPSTNGQATQVQPSLMVGVGASAGGLEALQALFAAIPADCRLAFVVLQHLDPSSSGLLPGLLAKATSLCVQELSGGTVPAPGHVYVAPAHSVVRLEEGVLQVAPAANSPELRCPIDAFFYSLAEARQGGAVGIVLSGNGTDGTLGMKAINDSGGMTIAQDPATAKYDSMPRSAATMGVADHVLQPEKMAAELLAYARHAEALLGSEADGAIEEQISGALSTICEILERATEHNFKHYKTSTLVRRIGRRMQVLRTRSAADYVARLEASPDEAKALFRELLIGVTCFFRDPEAFAALAQTVIPRLFENRAAGDPLRIWVTGCATGEEAYTLAILVREAMDALADPPEVQIFATDINERAVAHARQGIYPLSIAEDLTPERLRRFFLKKGQRYVVSKELRDLCLFSLHDLIRDPPFSRLDLISCRNLLIYMGSHLQKKLIPLFHYALRPSGFLFLGPSESLSTHRELFRPVDLKHRISQRLATAVRSPSVPPRTDALRVPSAAAGQEVDTPEPDLHLVMQRILLDEFAPKAVVVNEEGQILCASGALDKYLTINAGTFANNVVKLARGGMRVALRAALSEAIKTRRTIVHDDMSLKTEKGIEPVRLTVQPMPQLGEESGLFMVVFQDVGTSLVIEGKPAGKASEQADLLIEQLERELRTTRGDLEHSIQDLEAANEELKSSNEELRSMNEELQSANEELETSKEEIQSAHDALARTNADLENLLESTAIATIFLDEQLAIQRFTPAVTTLFNLIATDIGRPLSDITHRLLHLPPLPTSPFEGHGSSEDEVATSDDRHFIRRVHPYRTASGRTAGVVLTFVDITGLKQIEAALRQSEQKALALADYHQAVMANMGEGLYTVDTQGCVTYLNPAAEQLFGWKREELLGRKMHDMTHYKHRDGSPFPASECPGLTVLQTGQPLQEINDFFIRKDGSFFEVVYSSSLIKAHDQVSGLVVVFRDITNLRRVEQALREAARHKDEFLAMLAHELRNPLAPIRNAVQLLRLAGPTDPTLESARDMIERQVTHLVRLVDDLLDVSRITGGKIHLDKRPVDLATVVELAVESARPLIESRRHHLEIQVPRGLIVEADRTRLAQVVTNLLNNSAKYTEEGGTIVLAAERAGESVVLRVKDNGIGISAELLPRVFDLFTQAERTLDRSLGGLGIGLTLVKRLVEFHGGTVEARSEGADQGCELIVTLPYCSAAAAEVLAISSPPTIPASSDKPRVLVVDDNKDSAESLAVLLRLLHYDVQVAYDGEDALEHVHRWTPQVVFCDIGLPRINGYEVAQRLRALPEVRDAVLIALTGYGQERDKKMAEAAGFNFHFVKPVDLDILQDVLSRAVGKDGARHTST